MPAEYEIIVPHVRRPDLDAALDLLRDSIARNTNRIDADLRVIPGGYCPYAKWNAAAVDSEARVLVFLNNDMVMAPGWDVLASACKDNMLVTGHMIESGAIPVNSVNVKMDFGRNAATFQRDAFEAKAAELAAQTPASVPGRGWLQPLAIERQTFLDLHGYDTRKGFFPDPLDIEFFKAAAFCGVQFLRVNSWSYHFQRLCQR